MIFFPHGEGMALIAHSMSKKSTIFLSKRLSDSLKSEINDLACCYWRSSSSNQDAYSASHHFPGHLEFLSKQMRPRSILSTRFLEKLLSLHLIKHVSNSLIHWYHLIKLKHACQIFHKPTSSNKYFLSYAAMMAPKFGFISALSFWCLPTGHWEEKKRMTKAKSLIFFASNSNIRSLKCQNSW